jgi:hypothetical protein
LVGHLSNEGETNDESPKKVAVIDCEQPQHNSSSEKSTAAMVAFRSRNLLKSS